MKYISTRGGAAVPSAQAILSGIAPDGGLYMPEAFPVFTTEMLEELVTQDYRSRAVRVLQPFLTDFTAEELTEYVTAAYASFPEHPAPLAHVSEGVHVLELFHGPTCAFKDFALQMLPHLLTASLRKCGSDKTAVLLTATSGDTGSAALAGFSDVAGTRVCVFYPHGGVSTAQRLQMTCQEGQNLRVLAVRGNFDDAQTGVKNIFGDKELNEKLAKAGYILSSANSINWGRLAPQIVYYVSAWCDLRAQGIIEAGQPVDFVVPTGNFGDILAGYIAKRCGLPVGRLICASNQNKVLTDFFETGVYDARRDFYRTTSPSMDILISSNLERYLWLKADKNAGLIAELMTKLKTEGVYRVSDALHAALREDLDAACADEAETAAALRKVYTEDKYLCDPHTAVAFCGLEKVGRKNETVILSTASPFKFPLAVLDSLGIAQLRGDDLMNQARLAEMTGTQMPAPMAALRDKWEPTVPIVSPAQMADALCSWLKGE